MNSRNYIEELTFLQREIKIQEAMLVDVNGTGETTFLRADSAWLVATCLNQIRQGGGKEDNFPPLQNSKPDKWMDRKLSLGLVAGDSIRMSHGLVWLSLLNCKPCLRGSPYH